MGAVVGRLHSLRWRNALWRRATGRAKTKGRSPVAWDLRPHDRSRCAEHGGRFASA
jgi:hypothetical protein